MWHFVADPHLKHGNIIKYCCRPFMNETEQGLFRMVQKGLVPERELKISQESTDNMTDAIFDSFNATVHKNDTLVILGDYAWTPRFEREKHIRALRERINCDNVYLIFGNHDDREACINSKCFVRCYDQYMFVVDGQNIFTSHYPARSWDKAHRNSWMLYGHVHNLFWYEDNGQLSPSRKAILDEEFSQVLKKHNVENPDLVADLLDVVAAQYGCDLTLDVGVDNVRKNIPFGTPWSMDDLREYMKQKQIKHEAREKRLKPFSQRKGAERNLLQNE